LNILLIEDNEIISKSLKYNLELNDYKVAIAPDIITSKEYLNNSINLIILDLNLPDGSGIDLYKDTIKELSIPTIILTAVDDEDSIVDALDLGVEEYMTKPFSTKELLARIKRVILKNTSSSLIKIDDISYNVDKMEVYEKERQITLSSLELKLVNLLFMNINKVVSRNEILDKIWEWTGNDVDDHTVTVYFKRIREKFNTDFIKTVKGIGYRIDEK